VRRNLSTSEHLRVKNVNENIYSHENGSTNLTAYWLSMAASSSPSSSFKIAWIRNQGGEIRGMEELLTGFRSARPFKSLTSSVIVALIKKDW
jgi:hypothetical protein